MSSKINNNKKDLKASAVKRALLAVATKEHALSNAWFFKTGKGEYGEGDEFIGVTVPEQRKIAKHFINLPFVELEKLLKNKKHECRFTALLILIEQYKKGSEKEKKKIINFYLKNIERVNNWDLVDLSAPKILGVHYLEFSGEEKLYKLVKSKNMWERRIGIVATFAFIRDGKLTPTIEISELLLKDKHDLIHKAVGWMLREVGKKDKNTLLSFLKKNSTKMPRTCLRYSIERFPEPERKKWLYV